MQSKESLTNFYSGIRMGEQQNRPGFSKAKITPETTFYFNAQHKLDQSSINFHF